MTRPIRPPYGICDSRGRIIARYPNRQTATVSALNWAAHKQGSVSISHKRQTIAVAKPVGLGRSRLDEGYTPELGL